jgi:hypothetical protein
MFQYDFFRDLVVVFEFQGFAKLESVILGVPRIASGIVQKESQILRCAVVIKPLQILAKKDQV